MARIDGTESQLENFWQFVFKFLLLCLWTVKTDFGNFFFFQNPFDFVSLVG